MNHLVGRYLVGRYRLVDPIGSGGMGSVWRVWDARQRQYVAAKLLRPADAGTLLRFVREQSLRVVHPHVAAPQGWAAEDDQVLLTMDLVRGGSVAQLLDRYGALPLPHVAVLIGQLLEALAAVHSHGVVHRDVKPSNLLLEPTGRDRPFLRLADFGIAAVQGEPRLTQTHLVIGTPGYLAPEYALGAAPDMRQDLYAVGAVAARLLTGQPSVLPRDLPGPVQAVVQALLAESPSDRPDSAAAARRDWQAAIESAGVGPVDPARPGAIEVVDRLGPLPDGFGPNGPLPALPATRPSVVQDMPGQPSLAGPAQRSLPARLGWPAAIALGAAALALAFVVPGALSAGRSGTGSGTATAGSSVPSTTIASSVPGTESPVPSAPRSPAGSPAPGTVTQPGRTTVGQTAPAANSPRAPVDDSFTVSTTDGCGAVDFVDRGGNNDDVLVHDYCADRHGVKAYAWVDGTYLGAEYNGNGEAAAAVTWTPFGKVIGGQRIGLKVCLVDGTDDPDPSRCGERTVTSVDG
ncbi:MAG TPA: protein kinase [Amycolatopsis sp.]|uniref:serine/threonine-protein kinase n=1 Tax=Amycolatopsis sp. TaxID=37632 RepID=UPI002B49EF3A|nr:protein kinase [Amycolatopsis sp.]HKS47833.1 protein kinase [Amycolatopsis sp.]